MKFGEHLRKSLIPQYSYYYISYEDLKEDIDRGLKDNDQNWTEELETSFVSALESELDKVYTFCKVKHNEVTRRVDELEQAVKDTVRRVDSGSNESSIVLEFELLEDELGDVIADVHDLAKFSRLNYTGFQKIIKKHDKRTRLHLRPVFQVRLDAKPFFKENYDELVVRISRLYDTVRTCGNPVRGDAAAGGKQQNFIRQTTKYWVHPDNITEVKLIILKHLPVLVFNTNKEFEKEDSAITSIYYDNKNLDLYYGRLRKDEGAEAHRLRWYGGMNSDTIFVERKTHREDWTGEKSVKARFALKERHVNDFTKGSYTVQQVFEKIKRENKKSINEIKNLEALASEIQYAILKKQLRPVVRSFYNRTAFQLPGDARVRISLDTELTMVREDNFDGIDRTKGNWRRTDIGVDWPFKQLDDKDVCRFPYAVLEVKLQTQMGQEPPQWVRELVRSHLVEPVPKFSKFIHGVATLLSDKVNLIPFWLPQMDVDIRKPPLPNNIHITRPGERSDDEDPDDEDDAALIDAMTNETVTRGTNQIGAPNMLDHEEMVGYGAISNIQLNEPDNEEDNGNYLYYQNKINCSSNFASRNLYKVIQQVDHYLHGDVITKVPRSTVFETQIRALPGKAICVPVRVEPKVYFATERTFLSWISIAIFLGGVSNAMLTYGTRVTMIASIGFLVTALMTIGHAVGMYSSRVVHIRFKRAINYEDTYGPGIICGALITSMAFAYFCELSK